MPSAFYKFYLKKLIRESVSNLPDARQQAEHIPPGPPRRGPDPAASVPALQEAGCDDQGI